ncbi:HU family DNA-binding protein [Nocardioides guangzhouensis]|uniref:HU family DNA-binding protein n=1 Tax=Nocardioides guangzhouensis TaxID=2497878 RepID=A0A4Q4Z9U9_9ACTN|nr:HU family DNA-binding protein [Nocardioides guangzhouensis]
MSPIWTGNSRDVRRKNLPKLREGDCDPRLESLACQGESRARARPRGSLEGKLVNKTQLVDALATRFEGNRKAASHALESVLDTITREVAKGEKVAITGFGSFEKKVRDARWVRNPRTGERMKAKKTAVPKFTPGADLKNVISGAKKLPKLTATKAAAAPAKAAATAKAAASKATAKKTTAKKTTATKAAPAKSAAKKTTTAAKSTAAKKTSTAKKAPAKTTSTAKKTATKKTSPAKSTATKKTSAAKATATKKSTAAKKAPAKKAPAKKAPTAKKTTAKKAPAKKA